MSDRTKSAVSIDIQDVIAGKLLVPYHTEFGYATPSEEFQTEVKAIDLPVEVIVREDKKVLFKPGSKSGNIESITYSCILLNDLLDMDEIQLPLEPKTVSIELNKILDMIDRDELPVSWFIYHRNKNILKVNLEIVIEDAQNFFIEVGKSWEYMLDKLHKIMNALELETHSRGVEVKKDYSNIKSYPANRKKEESTNSPEPTTINSDFISDVRDIFK